MTIRESINHVQLMDLIYLGVQRALQTQNVISPDVNYTPPDIPDTLDTTSLNAPDNPIPGLASANSAASTIT